MNYLCKFPGCATLISREPNETLRAYCLKHDKHQRLQDAQYEARKEERIKKWKKNYDKNRPTASQRGYGAQWQKAAKIILSEEPLCRQCKALATVVDHIVDRQIDESLAYDETNLQPLCSKCHWQKHHSRKDKQYDTNDS